MIEKAVADAETRKFSPEILFTARLHPEMWSFSEQFKAMTNHSFCGAARMAGFPIPEIPDAVGIAAEMKARITATVVFIQSVYQASIDVVHDREITFPMCNEPAALSGENYFLGFTLPNIYFHHTTAFNILRHNGLPVSKLDDFLGGL